MASRNDQTASFMLRFTQNIFKDESGSDQVQWRGKISHVQGGEQQSFSEVTEAIDFIQTKLTDLTKKATKGKTKEEQEGILSKSFDIWKKLSATGAKMAINTMKDPIKGVAQIQEQIQGQFSQVSEDISNRLEIDEWRGASKSDVKTVIESLNAVTTQLAELHKKVDHLSQNNK